MIDFFKNVGNTFTNWFQNKDDEEEVSNAINFKSENKFSNFNPVTREIDDTFTLEENKKVSLKSGDTVKVEQPRLMVDDKETTTPFDITKYMKQDEQNNFKLPSLELPKTLFDKEVNTISTQYDSMIQSNTGLLESLRNPKPLIPGVEKTVAKFTSDMSGGLLRGVLGEDNVKAIYAWNNKTMPEKPDKTTETVFNILGAIGFWTGGANKFWNFTLSKTAPIFKQVAPHMFNTIKFGLSSATMKQLKVNFSSSIEERAKTFVKNLPIDIFTGGVLSSPGMVAPITTYFVGNTAWKKYVEKKPIEQAVNESLFETVIIGALKFISKPLSEKQIYDRIAKSTLNLNPNATQAEMKQAIVNQLKVLYPDAKIINLYDVASGKIDINKVVLGKLVVPNNMNRSEAEQLDTLYKATITNPKQANTIYKILNRNLYQETKDVLNYYTAKLDVKGLPGFMSLGGVPEIKGKVDAARLQAKQEALKKIMDNNPGLKEADLQNFLPDKLATSLSPGIINQISKLGKNTWMKLSPIKFIQKVFSKTPKQLSKEDITEIPKEVFIEKIILGGQENSIWKNSSQSQRDVIDDSNLMYAEQIYSELGITEPIVKKIAPEAPVVPLETIVTPEQAKPTVEPVITKEVQLLKQEAKKYKSAEEFAMSQGALTTDTLYQDKKQLLEYIKNKKDLDWDSISDELHSLSISSTDLNKAQSILENDVKETEKLLKKEQQLTDIWNKAQTTIKDSGYILDKDIKTYRGTGKGIGNSTLVKGEYSADSKKFASKFGDKIEEITIPKGAKIFDLDTVKTGGGIISDQMLVNPDALTEKLIDEGFDYTKNTNTRGVEYVKLNKGRNNLIKLARKSKTYKDFVEKVYKNKETSKEAERMSRNETTAQRYRDVSPLKMFYEEYNKPTVVTKTKEVIAKKELPKITAIQQKSTKVTKAQIDRTIRPTSDKISLTKKAGVKLNIRIQKAATKKVLASGRELRKKLISELKAEGFTPKQIQGEINNILKVNTQDRLEATKRKIIIKLEGTRRQQIDLDIRPKSETITKTISYLNKNRFRLLSKDVHKTIVSTVKSKNKLIRDLRAEGFSIKEIAKNFRKILRANTPETMELARQATIKSLTEQREFQVAKEKVQAETKLKKQLIKSIKKTSKDLIHTKLTDTNLEKFKELTDAITFSKPTAKTISKLTKTKKFLDGLLDSTDIAPNILDTLRQSIVRLEQKSLSEFTIPELVELNKSIKILQAQDSLIKTIKRGNIIRARDAVNKTANNQLRKLKQDTTKEKIKFGELSPLDSVTNMLGSQAKNYWNTMINPTTYASKVFKAPIQSELLDFIKQRTLGEQTLSMYDPWAIAGGYDFIAAENELTGLNNNFINWKNNLEISGKDSVVTGGVTNRNTYKLTSGKTLNITNAEKVSLVVYSKNIKSLKRLEHIAIKVGPGYDKYALSQTDIKNIKDSLAPKELEWVNKSIELTKTYAEQINKVSNRTEGYSLAKEANYMRMRILGVDGKEWLQDINQSMLSNKSINKATAKSKIGKQRTGSTKGFLVVDDFIKNLQNYHRDATAYIVYSEPIRNMEMLLKSTKDNMLSVKDGDKVYEGMNSFLQDMKSRVYEWDSVSIVAKKVLNIVRSNIMKANISMMLMQPASLLSVPLFIPEKYIVSATAEALVDFKKTIKLMEKYSPLAYTRYENQMLNYEISEFMMSNYNTAKNLKKQLGTFLMKPVSEADKLTTAIIWKAIAKMVDAKYPELSQEQRNIITAREWEIIIAKSQPSHHISTRSSLGRSSNPFIKGLLAFKSVTNKNLNILVESTKNKSQFLKALLYIVAGMSVFRATQKATVRKLYRKEKTTPKQFISDMAFAPLGMFYFTGDAIMSIKSKIERGIYSGWDYNTLLGTTLDSSVDAIALIFKLVMQDGNEIVKSGKNKGKTKRSVLIKSLITKGSQLFGLVTGLPITNLLRTYNATQTWMDEPTSKVKSNLYSVPKAPKAPKAPTFKAPKVPTFKAPKFKAPKF